MKTTSQNDELLNTVEDVRSQRYAAIPEQLVRQLVHVAAHYQEDRTEGLRIEERAIMDYLASEADDAQVP